MKNKLDTIVDEQGKKIIVINDVMFKGRKKTDWKLIEGILFEYVGKTFTINNYNDIIYIGKDFPEEYCKSNYTFSLNRRYQKVKGNIALGLPKIINEADEKTFKENKKDKHQLDAKFGWYRYITRFALPVFNDSGDIKQYNIYCAELLVRNDSDGKMYLYDIINIREI